MPNSIAQPASMNRHWQILRFGMPALGAALILFGWFCLFSYFNARESAALRQAVRDNTNLAVALDEETERAVSGIDQVMSFLIADYQRRPDNKFSVQQWISRVKPPQASFVQISVVGADGHLLSTSLGAENPHSDVSDREYFRVQRDHPDAGLFISRATVGAVTNRRSVHLSRRLNNPDGSFAGTVVVSLDSNYVARFLSLVDLGHDGAVVLAGMDGYVRAAASHTQSGAPMEDVRLLGLVKALQSGTEAGGFEFDKPVDGIPRIYGYRKVGNLPLVVLVAQSKREISAPIDRERSNGYLMGAAITLMLLILLYFLNRELARRRLAASQLRRQSEDLNRLNSELAEKTAILEVTMEHMDQGIMMIDKDLTIAVRNPRVMEMFGLSAEMFASCKTLQAILRHQWTSRGFDLSDPKSKEFIEENCVLETPSVFERELPQGRIIEIRNVPLPNGGAVRSYTDFTVQRAAERDLKAAKEAAEAATKARSAFLATMSHEIRTPLNGVIGLAHLLCDTELDPKQRTYVATLQQSADHLLTLINDVLDFSKLDTDNVEIEATPFEATALIQAIVSLLNPQARTKDLELSFTIDEAMPRSLIGDSARLRQILLNLVGNAIKFTAEGGVALSASAKLRGDGQADLTFTVSDTGIGIPEAALPELFKEFHQLDGTINRRYGGTGLGLAISRRLARRMGGDITVESTQGVGSRFHLRLTLPVSSAAVVAQIGSAAASLGAVLQGRAFRILLAEDNQTNQMVATAMLEREGCTVTIANNGRQAVEAVRSGTYDLVLMDMMMPEMDGLEATRIIRRQPEGRDLPILALTANAFAHDEAACRDAGMTGFVTKPINPGKLAQAVAAIVGSAPPAAPALADPAPQQSVCIDRETVAELRSYYGDDTLDFVELFLTQSEQLIARMGEATRGDHQTLLTDAHTLKGSSITFGCVDVSARAGQLEQALRNGVRDVEILYEETVAAFQNARQQLLEDFKQAA